MIQAATSFARTAGGLEAAERAAKSVMDKLGGGEADLVLVFSSARYRRHYPAILEKIRSITGAGRLAGASGYGVLTEEAEIEHAFGLAVLAVRSNQIQGRTFLVSNLQEDNTRAGEVLAQHLAGAAPDSKLLLLFPDAFSFQSHLFFDGFENQGGYVPILGGAAAEEGREQKTYQFEGSQAVFDAVSALALEGDFTLETGITRSCQPFGEPCRITRADGNVIYEMDGRPAYDMLLESLSQIEIHQAEEIFERIYLGVPLRSFQTDFSGSPYLIRNIMGVNAKKGVLACVAPVEEGEFVTFAVRDPALARHDMEAMLEDLKVRLCGRRPAFGVYFNCCARGEHLYGKSGEDAALIRSAFPGLPVSGFFTYGEIAPIDYVNHMHYHSGVLALVCEED